MRDFIIVILSMLIVLNLLVLVLVSDERLEEPTPAKIKRADLILSIIFSLLIISYLLGV